MKLTPWFPQDVKPVHEGFYECSVCGPDALHYWTGEKWVDNTRNIDFANSLFNWRGLAAPTKGLNRE